MGIAMPSEEVRRLRAIVLVGGKGERLYPYSATLPKPLLPLGEMPVLEILLRHLRRHGIAEVVLAVSHLGHLVQAYFGDGGQLGIRLFYSHELKPLGTAGPIAAVLDRMDEDFLVANGDLLTTMDISTLTAAHKRGAADVTIGVYEKEWKTDFGLIDADENLRFRNYREKPTEKHLVSMGIYMMKREAIRGMLRAEERLDMPDLMLRLRDAGRRIDCHLADCFWLDIGRPEDFALAQRAFAAQRVRFLGEE